MVFITLNDTRREIKPPAAQAPCAGAIALGGACAQPLAACPLLESVSWAAPPPLCHPLSLLLTGSPPLMATVWLGVVQALMAAPHGEHSPGPSDHHSRCWANT